LLAPSLEISHPHVSTHHPQTRNYFRRRHPPRDFPNPFYITSLQHSSRSNLTIVNSKLSPSPNHPQDPTNQQPQSCLVFVCTPSPAETALLCPARSFHLELWDPFLIPIPSCLAWCHARWCYDHGRVARRMECNSRFDLVSQQRLATHVGPLISWSFGYHPILLPCCVSCFQWEKLHAQNLAMIVVVVVDQIQRKLAGSRRCDSSAPCQQFCTHHPRQESAADSSPLF
jgi:hypothetical protein